MTKSDFEAKLNSEGHEWFKKFIANYGDDYSSALQYLRPLAEQSDAWAQINLAEMYESGLGVPQDYDQAASWYRKAAEQGNARAQWILGCMYSDGKGVLKHYETSVDWYRKSADQGYKAAQNNLAVMYRDGKGVPQDYVQAHMWFNLSIVTYSSHSQILRDIVAEKMTREQIAEAQKLAREWKPKTSGQ